MIQSVADPEGFAEFARIPILAQIISFSWSISRKNVQFDQFEPTFANLNPLSKHPGSGPECCLPMSLLWDAGYKRVKVQLSRCIDRSDGRHVCLFFSREFSLLLGIITLT